MIVRVLLFARARDLAESDMLTVDLPAGTTVADLRRQIVEMTPALGELLPRCAIAVEAEFAADDARLPPNAEVALIPPVSGG
jgi:molybdopterin converting factor subunit 1